MTVLPREDDLFKVTGTCILVSGKMTKQMGRVHI